MTRGSFRSMGGMLPRRLGAALGAAAGRGAQIVAAGGTLPARTPLASSAVRPEGDGYAPAWQGRGACRNGCVRDRMVDDWEAVFDVPVRLQPQIINMNASRAPLALELLE